MDTSFKGKHLKQIAGFTKALFLSYLQASQAYCVICVLNKFRQLGSSIRELNDKYISIQVVVYVYHNIRIESRIQ